MRRRSQMFDAGRNSGRLCSEITYFSTVRRGWIRYHHQTSMLVMLRPYVRARQGSVGARVVVWTSWCFKTGHFSRSSVLMAHICSSRSSQHVEYLISRWSLFGARSWKKATLPDFRVPRLVAGTSSSRLLGDSSLLPRVTHSSAF